jgi:hypothetical protein
MREQGTGNREEGTGNREQGRKAGSRNRRGLINQLPITNPENP